MRAGVAGMGIAVGAAIVSAVEAIAPASAKNRNAMDEGPARITLRIYDYVHLDHSTLLAAEGEASEILAQAGIEARWLDCPTSHNEESSFPDCPSDWHANDFAVRLLPNAMVNWRTKWQESLGSTNPCENLGTCTANVFCERVTAMATGVSASLPILLGRAMAHEIGHLLLGVGSHSPTGIMRASWSGQDFTLLGRPYLLFTREQSRQMKSRLAVRAQAWQAQMGTGVIVER